MLLALLRQYIQPYRRLVAVLMALQVISNLASLYLPTVNAAIIDEGVAKGDTSTIVRLGVVMLGVTAVQALCAVGAVYFGSRTGMGFGRDLRAAMFEHVITFSERETARFGAPTLLTRSTNDVRQIQYLVQITATVLVTAPIMCLGGIVMAIHQEAALTWLLLISVPVMALTNYWVMSHMLPLFRRMQALIDGVNRVMRDQLSGVRVVRAFAREDFERDRFDRANATLSNTALAAGNWQALMLPVTTLTINVSSVALIWFGGLRIDHGQMQVGSLTAFLAYFTQILMAVLMATMTLVVLPRASVCAERITEVLSTGAAVADPASPKSPPGAITGIVRLDRATFTYPGADRPVLQDISLTARPGTTTAIVGSTGSGKSTLISLICRLYDVTGGASRSTASTCVTTAPSGCGRRSVWSPNAATCSPGRSRTTCATAGPMRPSSRCGRRCGWPPPTISWVRTPTACTCGSPRAASTSRAGSGNDSPSPGRSSAARPSTCSTIRSPRSTPAPTLGFVPRCAR